jgi:hypothetical protein
MQRITDAELVIILAHEQGCSNYVGDGDDLCGMSGCECLRVVRVLREAIGADEIVTLAEAVTKFAPDLGDEIARRWTAAKEKSDQALEHFISVLNSIP